MTTLQNPHNYKWVISLVALILTSCGGGGGSGSSPCAGGLYGTYKPIATDTAIVLNGCQFTYKYSSSNPDPETSCFLSGTYTYPGGASGTAVLTFSSISNGCGSPSNYPSSSACTFHWNANGSFYLASPGGNPIAGENFFKE